MTASTISAPSRSGNPAIFERVTADHLSGPVANEPTMTRAGVAVKTLVDLAVLVAAGVWGWVSATEPVAVDIGSGYGNVTITVPGGFWLATIGAALAGFFCCLFPRSAKYLGIVYAALEGYCLGAIAAMFDAQTNGIVGAAILSTVCVFVVTWLVYASGIIEPTRKLAFGVSAAAGGMLVFLLLVFLAGIFDWDWLSSETFQTVGLIVTVLAIVLAALGLTLDFGSIDAGIDAGAPRYMEWYCAYGLMWTLIYLYLLVLRLLWELGRDR